MSEQTYLTIALAFAAVSVAALAGCIALVVLSLKEKKTYRKKRPHYGAKQAGSTEELVRKVMLERKSGGDLVNGDTALLRDGRDSETTADIFEEMEEESEEEGKTSELGSFEITDEMLWVKRDH